MKKNVLLILFSLVLVSLIAFTIKGIISKNQNKKRIQEINNELNRVEEVNSDFDNTVDSIGQILNKRSDSIEVFIQKKERLKQNITKQEFDSIMKILQNESIDIDSLPSGQ